ncbi:Dephospho-CoA kinase [Kickxella alabastrina]|uniref:Dephospho-CoA kinase n=1 Tax=Kickxella alabastrina TaxID=61397 RepID=A0ACC1I0I3_9FUNG|nr:Dephospho-CoA kinase [Kickxella alabastrina]
MLIVGLTGGIASGKSTASKALRTRGIPVIDADAIAHEIMQPGQASYRRVVSHFGPGILCPDRTIDRAKLGAIIFNDPAQRQALNQRTHPYVRRRILRLLLQHYLRGHALCVLDVPLLYESGMDRLCGRVVVVVCAEETQVRRLRERSGLGRQEAQARVRAQMGLEEKARRADAVVANEAGVGEMQEEVCRVVDAWRPGWLRTAAALAVPLAAAAAVPAAFVRSAALGVKALGAVVALGAYLFVSHY